MMKKIVALALALLLAALCLTGCSKDEPDAQPTAKPQDVELSSSAQWPSNEYTKGLPLPISAVAGHMEIVEESACAIYVTEGSGKMVATYGNALQSLGFTAAENLPGRYLTGDVNLTDGQRVVSLSQEDGMMVITVRMIVEK